MHQSRGRGVRRLALTLLLALPFALCLGCEARDPRPSLLLITVDTLRADALAPYARPDAFPAGRTPHIARLAREATLFERAATPMPLTRPSHFSIFTGRYPREHGVLNNRIALPDAEVTLAEILAREGYGTAAFVAVKLLDRDSGAGQGFRDFVAPQAEEHWPAERVTQAAIAWLDALPPDRPFFLWLHLFDPHQPYDPPGRHREGLDPALARALPAISWNQLILAANGNGGRIPRAVLEHARLLYRGEVERIDAGIGELLAALDRTRAPESTMVALTADHGECFERGFFFEHSDCLFDGAIRVPLLIRFPPEFAAGRRVAGQVSTLDILPTFLSAAGIEPPAPGAGRALQRVGDRSGRSILLESPLYQADAVPPRLRRQVAIRRVAGEAVADFDPRQQRVGILTDDWKYIRSAGGEALYAMAPAAAEDENRAMRESAARAEMGELLDRTLQAHPLNLLDPGEIHPELIESLRALGYVE